VEDAGCDTIILDLAGLGPLFGPLPKIARALARRASALGLEASVGVGGNPDTAALAARGFSGVTVIPQGKEAEQLGNLPVEVLFANSGADRETEQLLQTLSRWGIRKLRDLAGLPEVALSERLGQAGIHLQKLARGTTSRTLVSVEAPLIFEEVIELDYPLVLLEPLAFLLSRLLEQLCARLESRALATQELRLSLELENGCHEEETSTNHAERDVARWGRMPARQSFQRTLRLPIPLLDPRIFLKLLQLDLRAHPPGAPIVKIKLAAEPARPRMGQSELFLPPSPEPEKLELTLARIAGIVGNDKVGSIELLDTRRPEGFRMRHFAPGEPRGLKPCSTGLGNQNIERFTVEDQNIDVSMSKIRQSIDAPSRVRDQNLEIFPVRDRNFDASDSLVTALRIFRPPINVVVTLQGGKPAYLVCSKRKIQGEILWMAGPWRSSGDWWGQEGWARDEWDIAVQGEISIALYRLVHDLLGGGWFLEGTYD
jgi:protein ImuB